LHPTTSPLLARTSLVHFQPSALCIGPKSRKCIRVLWSFQTEDPSRRKQCTFIRNDRIQISRERCVRFTIRLAQVILNITFFSGEGSCHSAITTNPRAPAPSTVGIVTLSTYEPANIFTPTICSTPISKAPSIRIHRFPTLRHISPVWRSCLCTYSNQSGTRHRHGRILERGGCPKRRNGHALCRSRRSKYCRAGLSAKTNCWRHRKF
jgi:hypothetical protein